MDEKSRKPNLGGLLAGLGIFMFAAVLVAGFFGRRIPFFSENLFLPILMIFVGRTIARRSRARTAESSPVPAPTPPRRPTRASPPPARRPAPSPPAESPRPRTEADTPLAPSPPKPTTARPDKGPDEDMLPIIGPRPVRTRTTASGYNPRTSDQMIAEAKERLTRKKG